MVRMARRETAVRKPRGVAAIAVGLALPAGISLGADEERVQTAVLRAGRFRLMWTIKQRSFSQSDEGLLMSDKMGEGERQGA